jgi:cytochrome P450
MLIGLLRCLGRSFAIANMKTLLASLLQRYTFAWPDGDAPELVARFTLVNRPAVKGQDGYAVRMRITRVDG